MLAFCNDYSEGCHPFVLKRLEETNMEELPGYGSDRYTFLAKKKIALACGTPNADVYLLTGGTQSNQVVIASLLRSYEGVVSCSTGHIAVHVGDGDDLACQRNLVDLAGDRLGGFTADAGVDLVKNYGRDFIGFDKDGLKGKHANSHFVNLLFF